MKGDKPDISSRWEMHEHGDLPLKAAGRSYRRFTTWLDRELERLVARWAHAAAPNTLRSPPFRLRYLRPK